MSDLIARLQKRLHDIEVSGAVAQNGDLLAEAISALSEKNTPPGVQEICRTQAEIGRDIKAALERTPDKKERSLDAWTVYCEIFHEMFGENATLELSPAVLLEFADRIKAQPANAFTEYKAALSARGDIAVQPWALAILVHIAQLQRNDHALSAAAHAALEHAEQLMAASDGSIAK